MGSFDKTVPPGCSRAKSPGALRPYSLASSTMEENLRKHLQVVVEEVIAHVTHIPFHRIIQFLRSNSYRVNESHLTILSMPYRNANSKKRKWSPSSQQNRLFFCKSLSNTNRLQQHPTWRSQNDVFVDSPIIQKSQPNTHPRLIHRSHLRFLHRILMLKYNAKQYRDSHRDCTARPLWYSSPSDETSSHYHLRYSWSLSSAQDDNKSTRYQCRAGSRTKRSTTNTLERFTMRRHAQKIHSYNRGNVIQQTQNNYAFSASVIIFFRRFTSAPAN